MNFPNELEQAFSVLTTLGPSNDWFELTSVINQEYEPNKFEIISWLSYLIRELEERGIQLSDDLKAHGKVPISSKKLKLLKEFCNEESVNFILVTIMVL